MTQKALAEKLVRTYGTRDPFGIAKAMGFIIIKLRLKESADSTKRHAAAVSLLESRYARAGTEMGMRPRAGTRAPA